MSTTTAAPALRNVPAIDTPSLTERWGFRLVLLWAALLPVQVPLTTGERRGLNLALSDLVLVVAGLLAARHIRVRPGVWSAWHAALPLLFAASALFDGVVTRYSIANKTIGMVVLLSTYALITTFATSWERIHAIVRAFVLGVVIVTALTGAAQVLGVQLPYTRCHSTTCIRLTGYYHDANLFGALVAVALSLVLATAGTAARLLRPGMRTLAPVAILTAGLLMSLSRSAWLAMGASLVVLVFLRRDIAARRFLMVGMVAVGGVVLLIAEQSDRLVRTATRSHSINSRLDIVDDAIASFAESPLLGTGLGEFAFRHDAIVHNTPLWLAAEFGVVGLVVFTGLMTWIGVRLVRLYRHSMGARRSLVIGIGLAHVVLFAFSMAVEALYQRHWWMVMALIASAHALPGGRSDGFGDRVAVQSSSRSAANPRPK